MFIAYNLRRIINIIGIENIMKYLQNVLSPVLTFLCRIGMIFSQNKAMKILEKKFINFLSPV